MASPSSDQRCNDLVQLDFTYFVVRVSFSWLRDLPLLVKINLLQLIFSHNYLSLNTWFLNICPFW